MKYQFLELKNPTKIDAVTTVSDSPISSSEMSLSAFSPAMTAVALLSTLSWSGFIVSGFMLWATGNTSGGYAMVGIAICLPAVIAAVVAIVHGRSAPAAATPAATAVAVPKVVVDSNIVV